MMNAGKLADFDYKLVLKKLDTSEGKQAYLALQVLCVAMYDTFHLKYPWILKLKGSLTDDERALLREFKGALFRVRDNTFECAGVEFSTERLKNMFKMYFGQESAKEDQKEAKFDLLALEYSLSQIFTPRQQELLRKRLDGLSLTKSEREYYSRALKKKVVALANQASNGLHRGFWNDRRMGGLDLCEH